MAEEFPISDEVRELLRDLADDERAGLLRIGGTEAVRTLRSAPRRVLPSAPFLNRAESKLLAVHRDEVSRLLYRYSLLVAQRQPEVAARMHYADARPLPARDSLNDRTGAVLSGLRLERDESVELLRSCTAKDGRVGALSLLAAAARVAPSASIRIMQANCVLLGADFESPSGSVARPGSTREAEAMLLEVVEEGSSVTSYAWEALGFAAASEGDLLRAAGCYRRALLADSDRRIPALMWLRFAFLAGSLEETWEAAQHVDARFTPDDPAVRWCFEAHRAGNERKAEPQCGRVRQALSGRLGPVSLGLIHEESRS